MYTPINNATGAPVVGSILVEIEETIFPNVFIRRVEAINFFRHLRKWLFNFSGPFPLLSMTGAPVDYYHIHLIRHYIFDIL